MHVADASWEVLNWTIERAQEARLVSIDICHTRLASLPFRDREVDLVIAPLSSSRSTRGKRKPGGGTEPGRNCGGMRQWQPDPDIIPLLCMAWQAWGDMPAIAHWE